MNQTQPVSENLPSMSSQERLDAYNLIIRGCQHIYSKNKLQMDKMQAVLDILIPLTKKDPYFLANLTSYIMKNEDNKDLRVFLTYVSSLSAADGMPFSPGSKYKKPNLRYIAASALHMLDPKLAARVLEIASTKYSVENYFNESRHFPSTLKTALQKYLKYREANIEIIKGIKKAGLQKTIEALYRGLHVAPTEEVARILRWQQKDKKIKFDKPVFDFKNLTDLQIAEKIQKEKLPVLGVLGALPRKITPVIAVALLEQATGNQAVILRKTFEDAGVLKDPEVMKLYETKIRTAKTALDRAETLSKDASEEVKKALTDARSEVRKQEMAGLGKIFLNIDFSSSMEYSIEFAKERGAIIAECVDNPQENFRWGLFGSSGRELPLPQEFVKDAFQAALFGLTPNGSTDCIALYLNARAFGADVDIYITDQEHTFGSPETIRDRIENFHRNRPDVPKPRAALIINFGRTENGILKQGLELAGIPVAVMDPDTLTQSALVVQSVRSAILGPVSIIEDIMSTELLKLPDYYYTL